MKHLQLYTILFVIGCSIVGTHALPIEDQKREIAVLLPQYAQADLPASTNNPDESIVAPVPLTLLDVEDDNRTSSNSSQDYQRSRRFIGLGGFGGLGGLNSKFGGLGLGLKGNFGGWGLGGLHGLGLGGYKPLFGKYFG